MHMSYGEFCKLFKLNHSQETFIFWLQSHLLPPNLMQSVIDKAKNERTR